MKVIFCRGIQGSGKSTWAKAWVLEDAEHRIRINWGDMRNMLGKYWVPSREHLVKATSNSLFTRALEHNYDIVIDNMNLSESSIRDFKLIAERYGAEIEYQDFKTPVEVCIERDSHREAPIGEAVIRSTYNKYKEFYKV